MHKNTNIGLGLLAGALLLASCAGVPKAPAGVAIGAAIQDCPTCPKLVVVPAGRFVMGSPNDEPQRDADEGPAHEVVIAQPFAMGLTEVTRGEYAAFVRATGRASAPGCMVWTGAKLELVAGKSWQDTNITQTDEHPVVCVSWRDAAAYAAWLAKTTGKNYRLPSEAEWEYAARGGTQGAYFFPGGEAEACTYANVADASAKKAVPQWRTLACDDGVGLGTAKVGSYKPNGYGLHDMIGNVWEWMADCYHERFDGAPTDGSSWGLAGECGVALDRGGGFSNLIPGNLRPANRSRAPSPDNPAYSLGFRVARDLTPQEHSN
ncbi:MAG: formylglycine-generating enzyme family protein [Rhodospirillaceae bacterium]|nr:formylglycine-generating enzyme family protein [Rhodospirillaceae bacterium]